MAGIQKYVTLSAALTVSFERRESISFIFDLHNNILVNKQGLRLPSCYCIWITCWSD